MNKEYQKSKFRILFIGYTILAAMTLVLYGVSAYTAVIMHIIPALPLIAAVIGIVFTLYIDFITNAVAAAKEQLFILDNLYILLAVFLGAVITYISSIHLGLNSVVISGIVGVAAALFIPKYAAPAFCGSFAGMSSLELLPLYEMLIAALIAGIIYVLAKNILNGFGGKFGTIAFSACLITALIAGQPIPSLEVAEWEHGIILLAFSIPAAVLTYVLSVRIKAGPVAASGMMGIAAGIWLPVIFPVAGSSLAVMVFCASFVGMSNPKRIKNELYIAAAGLIAGLGFIYSASIHGAGGKLGTIAFGSVMAVYGIIGVCQKSYAHLKQKTK